MSHVRMANRETTKINCVHGVKGRIRGSTHFERGRSSGTLVIRWRFISLNCRYLKRADSTTVPTQAEVKKINGLANRKVFNRFWKGIWQIYAYIITCIWKSAGVEFRFVGRKRSGKNRRIQVFQRFQDNNVNHTVFRKTVEYVLCLLGSNVPVERIFSLMNNLWTASSVSLKDDVVNKS